MNLYAWASVQEIPVSHHVTPATTLIQRRGCEKGRRKRQMKIRDESDI